MDFSWIPGPLHRIGPLGLPVWQWVVVPFAFALALGIGRCLSYLSRGLFGRLAARTPVQFDDLIVKRLHAPVRWLWSLLAMRAMIAAAPLTTAATLRFGQLVQLGLFATFFWAMFRLIDIGADRVQDSAWAKNGNVSRAVVPLATKIVKVLFVAVAVISLLSLLGYPVASLIAGLGIGGIALALAAQKTVEDLFGAFAIGVDQPLREGDYVKVGDLAGTVEDVGLRSTRIRTADRTIVTVPNAGLASSRIENFAPRDRFRLNAVFHLSYETSAEEMRAVLRGLGQLLRQQAKISTPAPWAHFVAVGEASLDVEINAWLDCTGDEFADLRDDILLAALQIIDDAGTALARPVSQLRLETTPGDKRLAPAVQPS